jgi:hypothetical protein
MASKAIYVIHPHKKAWYSKKYYSKEFPSDLAIFHFPEPKYTKMMDELNRSILYDIGPVSVVLWFLLCFTGVPLILIKQGDYFLQVISLVVGCIPAIALLWFIIKQISDTQLNSILLDSSTADFTFTLDWYGRITVHKLIPV